MGKLVEFKEDMLTKITKKLEDFSPEVKVDLQELIIIKNQGLDAERVLKRMASTVASINENVKKNAESAAALQAYHERDFEVMREDVMNAKADEARTEERIEAARREGFAQGEKEGEKSGKGKAAVNDKKTRLAQVEIIRKQKLKIGELEKNAEKL